jgi:hypothetical protein
MLVAGKGGHSRVRYREFILYIERTHSIGERLEEREDTTE